LVFKNTLENVRADGRHLLTELESKEVLRVAGIPVVDSYSSRSKAEAIRVARSIGFPVVLKILSKDVLHKSDVGGVAVGIKNLRQVGESYDSIMSSVTRNNPEADIQGVSVQRMADPGVEVIIGASTDPQFGHVIMFGMGGTLVEILQDVSLRLVPLTPRDAREMVREIKSFQLLQGYRGTEPSDVSKLEEAILNLSGFLELHPEIREVDMNPVFCYPKGILAVDARIIIN
jgi:acyl-CoA synthetase (NDP forming)